MPRYMRDMSPADTAEWERWVGAVEAEYPSLVARFRLADAASDEDMFSRVLRRAIFGIHARGITLPTLLQEVQVDWPTLDCFLHGEGSLPSDVIDRLTRLLNLRLQEVATTAGELRAE